MKTTGAKGYSALLKRLTGPELVREVNKALFAAGSMVETDAAISITANSIGGKGHVVSEPHDPPNSDTGFLARGIETVIVGPLQVDVTSTESYSAALEFGSSKMIERPFLRPAVEKNKDAIVKKMGDTISKLVKRSGGSTSQD